MVEPLGAYEETYKTYLHPRNDLEGAPTRRAGETSTLTHTTGREIGLLLGTSAADTVTGHATGMTVTVEVVVINRSKYSIMLWVLTPPLQFSSKSKKNPPGLLGHMP